MRIVNVEDARRAARRKLPRILFDYIDGGAFDETTMRANFTDFARWSFRQRVLIDAQGRSMATRYLGRMHDLPFALGPVGYTGLYWRRGEIAAASAARDAGIPFCLSSFGIATLEELRESTSGPLYLQLYVLRDRSLMEAMVAQAEATGVEAIVLTVDTAVTAVRERDERNGFRNLTRITPALAMQFAARPGWCAHVLSDGFPTVGMVRGRAEFGVGVLAQSVNVARQLDPGLCWDDVAWLRRRWKGPLVLKGILDPEDARHAVGVGADAIVVSTHGGRQLNGSPSSISVLPEIAAAVGKEIEVLFDSGIRNGSQIVKALALGANVVFLGRAYAYGLGAAGKAGVAGVIEVLRREIDVTMALMGVTSIAELRAGGLDLLREARDAVSPAAALLPMVVA